MTDFRMRGFQAIPPVIKNLVILNALVFLAQITFKNNSAFNIEQFFGLHEVRSVFFKPHQLVTYMFLHGGWEHIFFNMFALWMFGSVLENYWGAKRFLTFYLVCGIGAGLLHLGVLYFEMTPYYETVLSMPVDDRNLYLNDPRVKFNVETIGASGSVFGCLAAFGYLFPNSLLYIYFLFPIKAKWFVLFYAAMELYLGVQNSAGDNVAHWAHLGGAAVGILFVLYWNKTNRRKFY
jgi:membrane associated rhomboid family serine protease